MKSGILERFWVLSWALALFSFSSALALGIYFNGLGVGYRSGFILEKGQIVREVNQLVGAAYFIVSYLMVTAALCFFVTSFFVYVRWQTLRVQEILGEDESQWVSLFQGSPFCLLLPATIVFLRLFGLLP